MNPTPLYDCHCHLQAPEFDRDRDDVIDRARSAGVAAVLAVAEDLRDGERVLALAQRHPGIVVPALGIHPDRATDVDDAEVAAVEALIRAHADSLGAIGEVGLDYRPCWDADARARQVDILRHMARLAIELDLPLTVHSRSAGHHAIGLLLECGAERVAMHAFDGKAGHAMRAADRGFSFSLPPSIVRSRVMQKLAPRLPLDALLLESDSPVLGPTGDERNEPGNVVVALDEIARLRGVDRDAVAGAVHTNTRRLFPRLATHSEAT